MVHLGSSSMQQTSSLQHQPLSLSSAMSNAESEQRLNILQDKSTDLEHVTTHLQADNEFSTGCQEDVLDQDKFPGLCVSMGPNGEVFNSAYIDTITSTNCAQFLIKPSDSDKLSVNAEEEVKKIFFKHGCTELHNHNDIREGLESETMTMLTGSEESLKESNPVIHETVTDSTGSPLHKIEEFFHHHLIPVDESDVLSLNIVEINPAEIAQLSPSPHTKIASTLASFDESFLLHSQSSLCSHDERTKHGKRAMTMQNLHEHSSFLDLTNIEKMGRVCQRALIYLKDDFTFGSLASLNSLAAKNLSNPDQEVSLIDGTRNVDIIPSTKHKKNVIAVSISITLLFIAMGSVRNLQSSLNQEGGVGIISMAVSFVGYMLGSIFSASIVQTFQPRRCIIISLIPNLIYVAANIYPTLWLMTIVSLIQGISLAIIWNAMSTYITLLSRGHALKKNEDFEKVSSNFFGIFCLIYQSYHVVGNLIASLVLMPGNLENMSTFANTTIHNFTTNITIINNKDINASELETVSEMFQADNETLLDDSHLHLCGAEFCHHFEIGGSSVSVSDNTKYMLFGIYMGCIVMSICIAAFLLEPLNQCLFHSASSPAQKMKLQLISLAKFSIDTRFLLLLPLLMYSIMQFGFISGEVTMAFITCPLGIHMVGYSMICFGVTASICSYISGIICKYTGRIPQIITAAALNLAVLMFMTQWQLTLSTYVPYFCVMAVWGVSDGIWNCQVNSLMGVVFSDKYEEAYAGLRVAQGLGVAILFSYSNLICMAMKIYIIAIICVFSLVCYLVMEGMLKCRMTQKKVPGKQTPV